MSENGRNIIRKRATQIDFMESFNAFDSKYLVFKKNTIPRERDYEDTCGNVSEIFYFSYPDNCVLLLREFASKVLEMHSRQL